MATAYQYQVTNNNELHIGMPAVYIQPRVYINTVVWVQVLGVTHQ